LGRGATGAKTTTSTIPTPTTAAAGPIIMNSKNELRQTEFIILLRN